MYGHPKTILRGDDALAALTRHDRLTILFTAGASGPRATHIPFVYEPPSPEAPLGRLVGHLARGNDHWKDFEPGPLPALVVMPGAETYVSPNWYPSKAEHGRVAPTWNFETIHAHGTLRIYTDTEKLRGNVSALSDRHEASQPKPWAVSDAPEEFTARLLTLIVGVEIRLEKVEAKRKLGQERPGPDRDGVLTALDASADARDHEVAAAMRDALR